MSTGGLFVLAVVALAVAVVAMVRARRTFHAIIREEAPRMTDNKPERRGIDTETTRVVTLESDGQWHAAVDGSVVDPAGVVEDKR